MILGVSFLTGLLAGVLGVGGGGHLGLRVGRVAGFRQRIGNGGVADDMDTRVQLGLEGLAIDRAPATVVGEPRAGGDGCGFLGRNGIDDVGFQIDELGVHRHVLGVDALPVTALILADPLDHGLVGTIAVQLLPAAFEQALLGELGLGIQDDHLGLGFALLQVVGDHAGALVARGHELEEEVRGLGLEGDVADLVDDDAEDEEAARAEGAAGALHVIPLVR